jgi:protein-tyrosine phosphatase
VPERERARTLGGVIDLHSHLLPGLDDGSADLYESVEMAFAMAADGVKVVCCTPHVRADYPTSVEAMEDALALVTEAVAEAEIAIDIRGGGEIALDRLPQLDAPTRARFGLGGNAMLLLLETPYSGWRLDLARTCAELRREHIVPVIAHPERNLDVQSRPEILEDAVRAGAYVQLTAASLDGRLGRQTASCAWRLLELELAHCIASDAHGPGVREAGLSQAANAVGGGPMARWLTHDVPAALLENRPPPPRPELPRRGFLSRLRR